MRGFQVIVVGRGAFHSTECARLDAEERRAPGGRRLRAVELGSALKRR